MSSTVLGVYPYTVKIRRNTTSKRDRVGENFKVKRYAKVVAVG